MDKILIITILNHEEDLLEQFLEAGIRKVITDVFFFRKENERSLLERIKNMRPTLIVLDGTIRHEVLEYLNDSIGSTLGKYDIPSILYGIKKTVYVPGVINTDIKKIAELIRGSP